MHSIRAAAASQLLLTHAVQLHRAGVSVIAVDPRTKKPAIPRWKLYQRIRPDLSQLEDWFRGIDNEQLGLAAVCGQSSGGLCVRDFDTVDEYHLWAEKHPRLARMLPTVETPRPGRHVYFRCNGKILTRKLRNGELRADGAYVVAPPSMRSSISGYRWLVPLPRDGQIPWECPESFDCAYTVAEDRPDVTQRSPVLRASLQLPNEVAEYVAAAIAATLPTAPGQRHRCIFNLARRIKASQYFANTDAAVMEGLIRCWFEEAVYVIQTKDFETTHADFRDALMRVRFPSHDGSGGSINEALGRSKTAPLPPAASRFQKHEIKMLVGLCYWLQVQRGSKPFYLACRDAATALNLPGKKPHVAAWRMLKDLCADGVLAKVKSGSRTSKLANEYRYLGMETSAVDLLERSSSAPR